MFHFQKFISSVCHNIFLSTETTDYPKCQGSKGWESSYYEYNQFPTLRWWRWPVPTEDTETTRRIKDMDHPCSQTPLVWLWCSDLTTFGPHHWPSMPSPWSPHAWNYPGITFQHNASLIGLIISPGPFSPAFWHLYLLLWFLPQWKCWPRHLSRLALIFWPTLR